VVLPYTLWPGVLPNPRPVGVEPAPGTGAEALPIRTAHHGICRSRGSSACSSGPTSRRLEANTSGEVWTSPMGTSFVDLRLSWVRFSTAVRWDAALSRRSSAVSPRTASRARWLHSCALCRAHRPLSLLSLAFTVQESGSSVKPRRVSAVLWPLSPEPSDASPPHDPAPPPLPLAPVLWKDQLPQPLKKSPPEHNAHTGVSHGISGWHAMHIHLMLPGFRSRSMVSPLPLHAPSVLSSSPQRK